MAIQERPITLGLIGAGRWGKNYITTIELLQTCRLKYICAKTQTTLNLLPDNYTKTTNYLEFFTYPDLDGVIIATPASTHFEIAKQFLERGYNLFIEKPVTATLDEAMALQKLHQSLSTKKKPIVLVGHIQVYNPAYTKLKEAIKFIGNTQRLVYKGLQSPPRTDVSVLEDWGPHPISIFLDFVGTSPNTVFALHTVRDNIHLEFEFPKNISAEADIGWTAPKKIRGLSVVGTRGSIVIDASNTPQELYSVDKHSHKRKNLKFTEKFTPLAAEINEFALCIRNGRQPKTGLAQAVKVMKIIELTQESANAGGKLLKVRKS